MEIQGERANKNRRTPDMNKDYQVKNIKCPKCGSNRIRVKSNTVPKCNRCNTLLYGVLS